MKIIIHLKNQIIFLYFWFWTNRTSRYYDFVNISQPNLGNNKHKAAALAAILKNQTEDCSVHSIVVLCMYTMYCTVKLSLYNNAMAMWTLNYMWYDVLNKNLIGYRTWSLCYNNTKYNSLY